MTDLQALFLGLVQGITEFFPISSSGHLQLLKHFLHLSPSPFFDLVCHMGTLFALLLYMRKEVFKVLSNFSIIQDYVAALLPLVPAYFLLKPFTEALSGNQFLGISFLTTSLLLFASLRFSFVTTPASDTFNVRKKRWNMLFIGLMQAFALIPGISRSGSTIAGARFCGWSWLEAAKFSFLLSIPAIFGGMILETAKLLQKEEKIFSSSLVIGFFASFTMGLLGVRFMFWIYKKEKIAPFAWYCLGMSLFTWAFFSWQS